MIIKKPNGKTVVVITHEKPFPLVDNHSVVTYNPWNHNSQVEHNLTIDEVARKVSQ